MMSHPSSPTASPPGARIRSASVLARINFLSKIGNCDRDSMRFAQSRRSDKMASCGFTDAPTCARH